MLFISISDTYKGIIPKKALYLKKAVQIPTPEFFVIYNGLEEYPDMKVLKLSDAYISPADEPSLELSVPVINIAKGHNKELLGQSEALSDYAVFVSLVYDRIADGDSRDEAIENTIQFCLKNGIMKEYLERYGSEVRRMLSLEWDEEVYREVLLEEGLERGRIEGRIEGLNEGRMEVARNLKSDGFSVEIIARSTGLPVEVIASL